MWLHILATFHDPGLDPMDIRLSDGDRIGKPQGKGDKPAQAKAPAAKPAQKTSRTAQRSELRAEPRTDARGQTRSEPRYESHGDIFPDAGGGGGGGRGGNGDGGGRRGGKPAPQPKRGKATKRKKRRGGPLGLFLGLLYWAMILGFWGLVAGGGVVAYYGAQLPSSNTWAIPQRPPNIKILAADGTLISNRGKYGGEAMSLKELPYYVPAAVIAIEDRRFMQHWGIDPIGIASALLENLTHHRVARGGSTLTQQLAKNLFLTRDQTLGRKVQEALLALWLERNYTKEEILELYLNRVDFGHQKVGIEAASQYYFGHSARNLTLAEAATLAGSLKAPSNLNPKGNPALVSARQRAVLQAMADEGYITEEEAKAAAIDPGTSIATSASGSGSYVADWVEGLVQNYIGDIKQDVVVQTTIDYNLQKQAEYDVRDMVAKNGKARHFSQGALVAMTPDGQVKAMVGGADYDQSQYNRAITARRQSGSAFKPMVYLTALEHGYTPDTIVDDAPFSYDGWSPQNDDHKFHGQIPLRTALAYSLNAVAARLSVELGPQAIVDTAMRMGISSPLQAVPSIALGTQGVSLLELTATYAPYANGGNGVVANVITKISTADGKVLYQNTDAGPGPVVSPENVGMMNNMLSTVVDIGTGRGAKLPGWDVAGKTGTSQKGRDALFVGYSAHMVTGVWLGNDNDQPTTLFGGTLPATIWSEFMQAAHKGVTPAPLPGSYTPSPEDLQAEQQLAAQQAQQPTDQVPADQQGPDVQPPQRHAPQGRSIGDLINSLFGGQ
ncbi:MAG TPA: PBP1A family penicillin-binding protein [Devosiaceae bacterium]|nr:PBP1A family penicillin-binding protein [Devosiaceae bacterium]